MSVTIASEPEASLAHTLEPSGWPTRSSPEVNGSAGSSAVFGWQTAPAPGLAPELAVSPATPPPPVTGTPPGAYSSRYRRSSQSRAPTMASTSAQKYAYPYSQCSSGSRSKFIP